MQPYQEASEETRRQGELPWDIAKNAASIAGTAASAYYGGTAATKVLSLVNKYVPQDLAIKGLSKIDPRYGKFIQKALSSGGSFDEVRDFITKKAEEGLQQSAPPKNDKNIVEQYDPELHTYLKDKLKSGLTLLEAGEKAKGHGRFRKAIEKLTKDHKTPWSTILESVYGHLVGKGGSSQQPPQQPNQTQPQQSQPQQVQEQINPAFLSILDKLKQIRGG